MPKRKLDVKKTKVVPKKEESESSDCEDVDDDDDDITKEKTLPVPAVQEESDAGMEYKDEPKFNVYVGTEIGILKGISLGSQMPISKSVYRPDDAEFKPPSVESLTWVDSSEKELLVCFSNHVVKTYNTKLNCFTRQVELEVKPKDEKFVGLCCHDPGNYVVGLEHGEVAMWNCLNSDITIRFKTGDNLRRIRQSLVSRNIYATGGQENDLKLWDLSSEKPEVPIFKAKNLPHDFLDLRIPVWIQDLTFLPRSDEVVAVGTRYGQVRLYDARASQRPVSNVQFVDHPIMSISATMNDRQVVVGTAKGEAGLYDLRNPGKEKLLLKYYGSAGSIRSIVASLEIPYFISCGLDRHLYVHKMSERHPVKKLYMNQQLNCIAFHKSFSMEETDKQSDSTEEKVCKKTEMADDWTNIPPKVLNTKPPRTKKSRKPLSDSD